jgi:hypothetical protein
MITGKSTMPLQPQICPPSGLSVRPIDCGFGIARLAGKAGGLRIGKAFFSTKDTEFTLRYGGFLVLGLWFLVLGGGTGFALFSVARVPKTIG